MKSGFESLLRSFSLSECAGAIGRNTRSIVPSGPDAIVLTVTRSHVRRLLAEGKSITEIARILVLSKSTVCYHARRLGVEAEAKYATRYDWTAIRHFYEAGHTARECRQRFGCSVSAWCDAVIRGDVRLRNDADELAIRLSRGVPMDRAQLKRWLIQSGLKTGKCEHCGIDKWRGRPLSIALHHINGRPMDNRLENLRLLCPNCHSQTENYGGRNRVPAHAQIAA